MFHWSVPASLPQLSTGEQTVSWLFLSQLCLWRIHPTPILYAQWALAHLWIAGCVDPHRPSVSHGSKSKNLEGCCLEILATIPASLRDVGASYPRESLEQDLMCGKTLHLGWKSLDENPGVGLPDGRKKFLFLNAASTMEHSPWFHRRWRRTVLSTRATSTRLTPWFFSCGCCSYGRGFPGAHHISSPESTRDYSVSVF